MSKRYFGWDDAEYTRNLDIIGSSTDQTAEALATIYGKPKEEMVQWINNKIDAGTVPIRPIRINAWVRTGKFQDREEKVTNILKLLKVIEKRELITAPTFTSYDNQRVNLSPINATIAEGFADRVSEKTQQKAAQRANDSDGFAVHNGNQNAIKVEINSNSGAAEDRGTPFHCKTLHPTLTSECRCSTGICTAYAEKSIGGSRNYHSPEAIEDDILGLLVSVDSERITRIMMQYDLHYPTVEECIEHIERNHAPYFKTSKPLATIYRLVESFSPVQRAAYLYYSNIYDLLLLNREILTPIFNSLFTTQFDKTVKYTPDTKKPSGNEQLMIDKMTLWEDGLSHDVAINRLYRWLDEYAELLSTFLVTDYHQVHLGSQDTAVRKVVPLGDTDSAFVSYQRFMRKFYNRELLDTEDNPLLDTLTYLTNEIFWHQLRLYTTKMGILPEYRDEIEMKSELVIPSLELTVVAKTYHAFVNNREGVNLPEERREFELKGKRFHGGSLPEMARELLHTTMEDNLIGLSHGKMIDRQDAVSKVVGLEQAIIEGIPKGEMWFTTANVKGKAGYRNWQSQPAAWTEFWNIFFGEKYDAVPDGEYRACKVPLVKMKGDYQKRFLRAIGGDDWESKWDEWKQLCGKNKPGGKVEFRSIYVPLAVFKDHELPPSLLPYVDVRLICHNVLDPWYLYLQSMNIFIDYKRSSNKEPYRIMSDFIYEDNNNEDGCA